MLAASDLSMNRPTLATLALLALSLALPHTAAAEETMCGLRGTVVALDASELDATPSPALPVFGAFSVAPAAAPVLGGDAGEVLWCVSADDPRCAPAHPSSGSTTQLGGGTTVFVIPASHPPVADAPSRTLRDARERSCARMGVRRSLDRPPR